MDAQMTLPDIKRAAGRIAGVIHRTPLDYSRTFSALTGSRVYFKLENLQKTGSFKIRGAYNKISLLDENERSRGVIAASAGNHAQGVAYAASLAGINSTIIMPESAPMAKVMATREYGARVILDGKGYDEAYDRAVSLQREMGAVMVHGFNDPDIITGQGTLGLELLQQLPGVDVVLVPIGGGGLAAGVSLAIKETRPRVKVIGVQAGEAAAVYMSKKAGRLKELPGEASTIADGIAVRLPGDLTFEVIRQYVDDIVIVDEEEIARSILMLLERSKLVVEGAGAVAVAALLQRRVAYPGAKIAIILSGGNIDMNVIATIIERGLIREGRRLRLRTLLSDRPGSLNSLLSAITTFQANVISIHHDRANPLVPLKQAGVELVLETRDQGHINVIVDTLRNSGYQITV
ncbi:MAG: threonine ammonia-lyase [Bacillota bacterium]|jgi:threonine dehydratase